MLILILAENALLVYTSHVGVGGELKHFIVRQYLVFVYMYSFQKKEVYIYVKGHTTYNQKVC